MNDPKALLDRINDLTTKIDACAEERAKLLDEWAALTYPYKLGDHVEAAPGKRVRITGIKGDLTIKYRHEDDTMVGYEVPCVAVSYKPVKKDGTDSLRYGGRFFWIPGEGRV